MLTIAVIGHTDIPPGDFEFLRDALLGWWKRRTAGEEHVRVLTALASGADQLVATVLTTGTPEGARPDVRAVLPFAADAYAEAVRQRENEDYPRSERYPAGCPWSFAQFEEATASPCYALQPQARPQAAHRAGYYQEAARCLVHHADVLLALWDGVHVEARGGTSETLRYAMSADSRRARGHLKDRLEIHCLTVRRTSNPHPAGDLFTWRRLPAPPPARPRALLARGRVPRLAVAVAFGVMSVATSTFGYMSGVSGSVPFSDALLRAISHLTLNGFDKLTDPLGAEWVLTGRALAVLCFTVTAVTITNEIFRWFDRLGRWGRVTFRHPDLALGSSVRAGTGTAAGTAYRFAESNAAAGRTTIAVARRPDVATIERYRQMRVPLVDGDPTQAATLKKAGISRARTVLVAGDTDEESLRIVHALAPLVRSSVPVCVRLRSLRLLGALRDALPPAVSVDLRIFDTAVATARALLKAQPIDRFAASPGVRGAEAVIIGDSEIADGILRELLQQGVFEDGKALRVIRLTADPKAACEALTAEFRVFAARPPSWSTDAWTAVPPEVWRRAGVLPEVCFFPLPSSGRGLLDVLERGVLTDPRWVTTVFIADGDASSTAELADTTAAGVYRLRTERSRDVVLACYDHGISDQYRRDLDLALNRRFPALPIVMFADFGGQSVRDAVRADDVDRVARRVNGIYSLDRSEWRGQAFDAKCDDKWRELPEIKKESNRLAAAHAWVKERIRQRLRASKLTPEQIDDALAEVEHRRWCAEHLLRGFRPLSRIPSEVMKSRSTAGFEPTGEELELVGRWFNVTGTTPGDKAAFQRENRHFSLVPAADFEPLLKSWPGLADAERNKDRNQTEMLDAILA